MSGNPSTPPATVRFEWDVYKDGVFFGSETIVDNFNVIGGGFGFAVGSSDIDISACGEYYAEVTAIGVDASGNDCFTTATFTTDEVCISQINDGLRSFACDPDIACSGPGTARLAAPTALTLAVNPAVLTDRLLFETSSPSATPATLRLLDLQGRAHFEATVALSEGPQAHKFALPELPAGIYLLQVATEREQVTQKVIVR